MLVVHALTEAEEAQRRAPSRRIITTFLPVHELGGSIPSRDRKRMVLAGKRFDERGLPGHFEAHRERQLRRRPIGVLEADRRTCRTGRGDRHADERSESVVKIGSSSQRR